jgi:hypothetical protein
MRNTLIHFVGRIYRLYLTGNILRLRYKAQPVNSVWGKSLCLFWEPYESHRYTVWALSIECTSHETNYFTPTKTTGNDIWGKNHGLLWEPYGTHRYTVGAECRVFTRQEIIRLRYKSQPVNAVLGKQSLFILRTIWNTQTHSVGWMQRLYLTGNILRLRNHAQPVNAVLGNNRCL